MNKKNTKSESIYPMVTELTRLIGKNGGKVGWIGDVELSLRRGARLDRLYAELDELYAEVGRLTLENAKLRPAS